MGAVRLKVLIGMFLLCSILAVGWAEAASADTITNVNASVIFPGGPGAPYFSTGLGANETFSTTFNWDVSTGKIVSNSMTVNTTGPLGPFTLGFVVDYVPIINFVDPGGTLIQIYLEDYFWAEGVSLLSVPGVYHQGDVFFIACTEAECPPTGTSGMDLLIAKSSVIVVTATPEPGTLVLTLIGMALIGLVILIRKYKALGLPQAI